MATHILFSTLEAIYFRYIEAYFIQAKDITGRVYSSDSNCLSRGFGPDSIRGVS